MNLYNHGKTVIILVANEYEYVYTSNTSTLHNIKLTSLTPVSSYIASHCICTPLLYVCMYVHLFVTVLTSAEHGSFNTIHYWELSVDSVFTEKKKNSIFAITVPVTQYTAYHIPNTECTECIWWKGKTTEAEVLQTAFMISLPQLNDFRHSVGAKLSIRSVLRI